MSARLDAAYLLACVACALGCSRTVEIFELAEAGQPAEAGGPADGGEEPADADVMGNDAQPAEDASGNASVLSAFEHTCAVDESGLFCWGRNDDGQLGLGEPSDSVGRPSRVEGAADYAQVCAGEHHTCGLRPDGALDCWGGNALGQLGVGDTTARLVPTPLVGTPRFQRLACGGNVSCAVAEQGALYCWGENAEGELGQGESSSIGRFSDVPVRVPFDQAFRQVSVGQGHVCAIAEGGPLYCWGRNSNMQLGIVPPIEQVHTPTLVTGAGEYRHVAAGQQHTCAVHEDGRLFCWGFDLDGRLGLGANVGEVLAPTQVGGDTDYLEVRVNWFHSCALRASGLLSCWGRNDEGQLGLGDLSARHEPESVGAPPWSAVTAGRFHTCGVSRGAVYCWGENRTEQQLGLGDYERRSVPTWVPIP